VVSFVIRTIGELGADLSFAPERQRATALGPGTGVTLGELVDLRSERFVLDGHGSAVVLDTTHAKDGLLDMASARRALAPPRSAKKVAKVGDLLVSRLRPYLRQIAFVHPGALSKRDGGRLACSTEYYVLMPRAGDRLEYLLPFLLGAPAQAVLAAGQEGGHHPRVPLETLLAMRVPEDIVRRRAQTSARVHAALGAVYRALADLSACTSPGRRSARS
jgi:hypothetical protein